MRERRRAGSPAEAALPVPRRPGADGGPHRKQREAVATRRKTLGRQAGHPGDEVGRRPTLVLTGAGPELPSRAPPWRLNRGAARAGRGAVGTFSPVKSSSPNMVKTHRWSASSSTTLGERAQGFSIRPAPTRPPGRGSRDPAAQGAPCSRPLGHTRSLCPTACHVLRSPLSEAGQSTAQRGKPTSVHLGWMVRGQPGEPLGRGLEVEGGLACTPEQDRGDGRRAGGGAGSHHGDKRGASAVGQCEATKGLPGTGPECLTAEPPARDGAGVDPAPSGPQISRMAARMGARAPPPPCREQGSPPPLCKPGTRAHLAISGSDQRIHFSVFFIMEEFCSRKKGRKSRRIRRGCKRPGH